MITYYELLQMIKGGILPKYVKYGTSIYDLVFFNDDQFSYIWNKRDDLITRINYKCSDILRNKCIELPDKEDEYININKEG